MLKASAIAGTAACSGCGSRVGPFSFPGAIIGAARDRGHELRGDRRLDEPVAEWHTVDVVIVGGGVAGLASAWTLDKLGLRDFVLLELEEALGGTSRGGRSDVSAYPWGAHYLPTPMPENIELLRLLHEAGAIEQFDADGSAVYAEEQLCRDPEERLFYDGQWHEDLLPSDVSDRERGEWDRFRIEVDAWVAWRDPQGRRAFVLPSDRGSDDPKVAALDAISMTEWMEQRRFHSPFVRWEIEYACRDDYGTTLDQTSAWAGLFYFASRIRNPGESPQPLLTWPEGNGRLVRFFADQLGNRARTGMLVTAMRPAKSATSGGNGGGVDEAASLKPGSMPEGPFDGVEVVARSAADGILRGWRARHAIFAGPQFIARRIIENYDRERGDAVRQFTYAPWLVANLHLRDRPVEHSFPVAWDNVIRDGQGLGYVVATHQSGRDHGPTVLTYYRPLCEFTPSEGREWLESCDWNACVDVVLRDLEIAHSDLRPLIVRLDVMHWGHAMIRPVPGFRFGTARARCQERFGNIQFAHTDLSGIALFEEAFAHGCRAAREIADQQRERVP